MQAMYAITSRPLVLSLTLAGLLAVGLAGYWFGADHGQAAAGALAEQQGPKAPAAQRNPAVVAVVTRYPNRAPEAIESAITDRLEHALRNAEGLRTIESQTTTGLSIVRLHFDDAVAPPVALAQTAALAATVVPQLPPGTSVPEVSRVDPARPLPACVLVLDDASASLAQLADMARQHVLPELASHAGITAHVGPAPERVLAVMLDPLRLRAFHVDLPTVVAGLEAAVAPPISGVIHVGKRQYAVTGPVPSVAELENVALKKGRNVYLRDVAKIEADTEEPTALTRVNGRRCVWVAVHGRSGIRDAAVRDTAKQALAHLQGRLPQGTKLRLLTFGNAEDTAAGVVTLHVQAAAGTRLAACEELVSKVEQYLTTAIAPADLRFMLAHVGPDTSGRAAWPLRAGPYQATIRLQLDQPAGARELVKKLRPQLRERFADLRISVHAGSGVRWPVVVHIGGGTLAQGEPLAGKVRDRIAKLPGATEVVTSERLPALRIDLDQRKAGDAGVGAVDVRRALLGIAVGQPRWTRLVQVGKDITTKLPLRLRIADTELQNVDDISVLPIASINPDVNRMLRDVATVKTVHVPAEIAHHSRSRVVVVRVNTDDADVAPLAREIERNLKDLPLPKGMWLKVQTLR